jgi:hypothetical protein
VRALGAATALGVCALAAELGPAIAGPPYVTDDPDPTEYRHWEIYTGLQYENDGGGNVAASLPFAELNYGALPNVQVSTTIPVADVEAQPGAFQRYGSGGIDFGIKTRFVQESENRPQISFYPSIQTPTAGLNNHVVTFLPIWMQKSWGTWTAFGGGGLYLNPGLGQRNYAFFGGALERAISPGTALGAELFHQGSSALGLAGTTASNVGAIFQVGPNHAILFSVGGAYSGFDRFSAYASYEYRLGPKGSH